MRDRKIFPVTTILLAVSVLSVSSVPSTAAAVPLRVSGDFIYEYNDTVLRRYPSRYAMSAANVFKLSHNEYADEIVTTLQEMTQDFPGSYAELRPFVDQQSPFANIIAVIPGGDPVLRNEYVLVGGHYDCVPWTLDGAIDCGMQVALTLGILKAFIDYWKANDLAPRRSLMVALFDGEEQCLCGSLGHTTTDSYRGVAHLELPPQASAVAYHDTDMIGANYPGRWLGRSDLDFMPLNVSGAPTYSECGGVPCDASGPARPWSGYATTGPGFAAKFLLYRQEMLAARDRLFADMHDKFGQTKFTYRDGQTRPLFTESQKKYVTILDDTADRSDHSILIINGIPSEISIGLWDPDSAPPGLLSYHNAGETLEFLNYLYSGQQRRAPETVLGIETAAMWVAYAMGANHPDAGLFLLGEMGAP